MELQTVAAHVRCADTDFRKVLYSKLQWNSLKCKIKSGAFFTFGHEIKQFCIHERLINGGLYAGKV